MILVTKVSRAGRGDWHWCDTPLQCSPTPLRLTFISLIWPSPPSLQRCGVQEINVSTGQIHFILIHLVWETLNYRPWMLSHWRISCQLNRISLDDANSYQGGPCQKSVQCLLFSVNKASTKTMCGCLVPRFVYYFCDLSQNVLSVWVIDISRMKCSQNMARSQSWWLGWL